MIIFEILVLLLIISILIITNIPEKKKVPKYIKIPTKTYKASELNKIFKQEEEDNEISKIYRDAGYGDEESEVSSVITWYRLPLTDFEGCSYDSTTSREDCDEDFQIGELSGSLIMLKNGMDISCLWSIERLEEEFIKYGIVHSDIKNQKEVL